MSDDKAKSGPQDAQRVNVHEDYELQYWTNRFNVSAETLKDTVSRVGTSVDAVAKELES
ncbi:DUF3606 domain-containing protein [Sphingobium sufflavum]|uniref:DUF3606 domain-containing protein n=1 Tax=Sphingobium sufflavum TaxID=1129547 RepID=UPI001F22C4E1|nr:DUF3606 domain-containing protein [Sphingobium sufflavum]MCE7798128.1 DUF3606 domain-containing protein [Sphingobium sufflavum]